MLKFSPPPDFEMPPKPVLVSLYDATEALRIAAQALEIAAENFDPDLEDEHNVGLQAITEARGAATLYASIFQEIVSGRPSVPDRVFREIKAWENRVPWNQFAIEIAVLALTLAATSTWKARGLLRRLGRDTGDFWLLVVAADRIINADADSLRSSSSSFTCPYRVEEVLEAMIAGESTPSVADFREFEATRYREFLSENPSGNEWVSREEIEERIRMLEEESVAV